MIAVFFTFSILVIALSAFSLFPSLFLVIKTKRSFHKWLGIIILMIACEIAVTEYFTLISLDIDLTAFYTNLALPRLIISSLVLAAEFFLLLDLFERPFKWHHGLGLLLYPAVTGLSAFYLSSAAGLWFYFSVRQFFRFGLILLFLYWKRKAQESSRYIDWLQRLLLPAFILNLTVLIEDSLTFSQASIFFQTLVALRGRNISEFILWTVLILAYLRIAYEELSALTVFRQQAGEISSKPFDLTPFIQRYKLTPREAEVVEQLALNKSTADVAEALYISPGTLKTHLHNIYTKTETATRIELMQLLSEFLSGS